MSRPLRNRAAPDGEIHAVPARGTLMGNRGGRLHEGTTLGRRRWVSRRWICCVLEFRGRRREVMGAGYTELFFLDDAVALAAGHRPCFECRRAEARAFAAAWAEGLGLAEPPGADAMDRALHAERLGPRERVEARALPEGAMYRTGGGCFLVRDGAARRWGWEGYGVPEPLPRGEVEALTPASSRAALTAGWRLRLHESAG